MDEIKKHGVIGIIGGSGLYDVEGLKDARAVSVPTPYGDSSDMCLTGTLGDVPVVFLARHGRGHRLIPSEVPYRANIYALKSLGVTHLLSIGAVGSLREGIRPCDMVVVNQYVDFTKRREMTFFGDGLVGHVSMAQPTCVNFDRLVYEASCAVLGEASSRVHLGGTYVCIEGPQFSSLAESHMYQRFGADVVGMTNMPEARLAREAQMAYSSLAMVTDYDCWHETHSTQDVEGVLENLRAVTLDAKRIVPRVVRDFALQVPASVAHKALDMAVITEPAMQSSANRALLKVLRASCVL